MTETLTPHQALLIKAHKQSARQRWTDHFILQLRAHQFIVMDAVTYNGQTFNATDDMRKIVVREFKFHPERQFRLDFAIPVIKLAIEIEGGIWMRGGGAHSRPANIMRDVEKSNLLALAGWKLLRFTDKEIRAGTSIEMTIALAMR